MSACLGIPTERVDALTFALGSGLAGIAGCAVTLLGSVGPNLGANYIVDAFMVVVVGGVGKLVGSIVAALVIGIVTYLVGSGTIALILPPTAVFQPLIDFFHLLCHNQHGEGDGVCVDYCVFYRSDLPVCSRRKVVRWSCRVMTTTEIPVQPRRAVKASQKRKFIIEAVVVVAIALILVMILPLFLSGFRLNLVGRFLALAIVALGIDLIWGFTGLLSLGQGIFFALGGYAFAMYLSLNSLEDGQIPDFFSLYGVTELPWFWQPFNSFPFTLLAIFSHSGHCGRVAGVSGVP